jgi:hypothetical protein
MFIWAVASEAVRGKDRKNILGVIDRGLCLQRVKVEQV